MITSDDHAIYDAKEKKKAEKFYGELLDILLKKKLPFMIGGTYAYTAYTGIERPTKDIDIRTTIEDYPNILQAFSDAGLKTEMIDHNWLAKVYSHDQKYFTDIIFGEGRGIHKIEKGWFDYARDGVVLGRKVKLEPIEDMMRSKMYIQFKERFDGADVVNFILKFGPEIDWQLLLNKMDPHWELILQHVVLFNFVYPSERAQIPDWVWVELLKRIEKEYTQPANPDKVTRGLLLSTQYEPAVTMWGYHPIHELK